MKGKRILAAAAGLALLLAAGSAEAQRRGGSGRSGSGRPGAGRGGNFGGLYAGGYGNYWGWGTWGWGGASIGYARPSYFSFVPETDGPGGYGPGEAGSGPARIRILVPAADALVLFGDHPTRQQGTDRTFETPPLPGGRDLQYTITASWTENGRRVSASRQVAVRPGAQVLVNFTGPPR